MEKLDIEGMLWAISPEAPSGTNIEYDPAYLDLETMARGKTAVQFRPDEPVTLAEDPNWEDVEKRCLDLLQRSKHLRVVLYLTIARLRRHGIAGLRDGLALLHGFLERYWDTCYPRLDAEDNNDPTERLNVIGALSLPPEDRIFDFRDRFLKTPLCESRRLGRFGLRQILLARGELAPSAGQETPEVSAIESAFEEADPEALKDTLAALDASAGSLKAVQALLVEKLGADKALNFDDFLKYVARARLEVARNLERRGHATGVAGVTADAGPVDVGGSAVPSLSGTVNSAQDVIMALDRICDYYSRREPSSPIPLLLKRARRLVGKSFTDIIQDMSPEAMTQIKVISGVSAVAEGG
jgi:type VI secretion system protein ImpA